MTAVSFAALADAGWAAVATDAAFGWKLRFASGVTKRANSAWAGPSGGAVVSSDAFAAVEAQYRSRGLGACFQLSPGDDAARDVLVERGYRLVDDTRVLAASVPLSLTASREVDIARAPSAEWLGCWWAVDGRGGDAELQVARQIVTATPSLYAALRVDGRVVSVARLALVGSWGGLYCVATLADHRRRGYSALVIESLLAAAAADWGVTDAWLQVLSTNAGATALYSTRFGFSEVERYRYLVGPAAAPQ